MLKKKNVERLRLSNELLLLVKLNILVNLESPNLITMRNLQVSVH